VTKLLYTQIPLFVFKILPKLVVFIIQIQIN